MSPLSPWSIARHLFETDDGGLLPDIFISNLSVEQADRLYLWFLTQSDVTQQDRTAWSEQAGRAVSLVEIAEPIRAVAEGRICTFRHGLQGLEINGVVLPLLTISHEVDGLSLDYRMGAAWGMTEVMALFELLRQAREVVPSAVFLQADEGMHLRPNAEFNQAFDLFLAGPDA